MIVFRWYLMVSINSIKLDHLSRHESCSISYFDAFVFCLLALINNRDDLLICISCLLFFSFLAILQQLVANVCTRRFMSRSLEALVSVVSMAPTKQDVPVSIRSVNKFVYARLCNLLRGVHPNYLHNLARN